MMRPVMSLGVLISLLVAAQPAPSLGQGRAVVESLRSGQLSRVWRAAAPELTSRFQTQAAFERFAAGLRSYGDETKVVSEGLGLREDGLYAYSRVAAVSNWARGLTLELLLDGRGRLAGASFKLAEGEAPTAYGAYRSLVKLRLPVEDTWHVLWGGRTWEDNRHASVSDMRFALDLLQRQQGTSARGQGRRNDEYHAWNQPVVAPADGVVVAVVEGVPDNQPNRAPGGNLYGNMVVIDHGTDEFSLLAHLKAGSVLVKPGERVAVGQRLARVGNSGMSTEPHLHYQLMDTPDWKTAHGLPVVFHQFVRNGTLVDRGEPRRADVLTPVASEARR